RAGRREVARRAVHGQISGTVRPEPLQLDRAAAERGNGGRQIGPALQRKGCCSRRDVRERLAVEPSAHSSSPVFALRKVPRATALAVCLAARAAGRFFAKGAWAEATAGV